MLYRLSWLYVNIVCSKALASWHDNPVSATPHSELENMEAEPCLLTINTYSAVLFRVQIPRFFPFNIYSVTATVWIIPQDLQSMCKVHFRLKNILGSRRSCYTWQCASSDLTEIIILLYITYIMYFHQSWAKAEWAILTTVRDWWKNNGSLMAVVAP